MEVNAAHIEPSFMTSPGKVASQKGPFAQTVIDGSIRDDQTPPPCPLCGELEGTLAFDAADEFGNHFPVRACSCCQSHFLFPTPTSEQLEKAYAVAYYGEGSTKFGGLVEKLRDRTFSGRTKRFARNLQKGARILDIGCGDGRLLRQFTCCRNDLELFGVELPGPAAERTRATSGITLKLGSVDSVEFEDSSFDFISMIHVIEHVPSPRQALKRMVRWLKPGGTLFLAFPNIDSWQARCFGAAWFHLDPPRHLSLVAPRALQSTLLNLGLELTEQRHFCAEQNLYGWIQSLLNRFDTDRNFLYERLKRNRGFSAHRRWALFWQLPIAGLMIPFAIIFDVLAALSGRGATVELTFKKTTPSHHVSQ